MTLAETIQTHLQALPPTLQRETLDFIAWLETRYGIAAPGLPAFPLSETDAFLHSVYFCKQSGLNVALLTG